MKKYSFIIAALLAIVSAPIAHGATYTWNLTESTGWGDGTMPDGDIYGNESVWYFQSAPAGNFSAYTNLSVWDNHTNANDTWGASSDPADQDYFCLVNRNFMHPGYASDAVIRFVAPMAGDYSVDIQVYSNNPNYEPQSVAADGQNIYLFHNSAQLDFAHSDPLETNRFQHSVTLEEGDSILLRVNKVNYNSWDGVSVNWFTLETSFPDPPAVPEPATVTLLLLSCLGILKKSPRK